MRILMVNNLFPPQVIGGAEIVMRRHANLLRGRGHQISVLAGWLPGYPGERSGDMSELDGMPVYRFPFRTWDQGRDFHIPLIEAFLDRVLDAEAPEVVHVHNARGLGANVVAAARRRGLRVLVTLHDYWWHCHWATLLRLDGQLCRQPHECGRICADGFLSGPDSPNLPVRLRRDYLLRALDLAHAVVSPSTYLAAAYEAAGVARGHITVLSNGIDLGEAASRTAAVGGSAVRFLAVQSLAEHKGVRDLIEAAALLHSRSDLRGRWRLAVAGAGELADLVSSEIASGRLGAGVSLLGPLSRSDVLREYTRSDAVILASRWPENEPVVLLEAAAAGLAQIATSVGGVPELVEDGRSGLLVPPRDPAELARAMERYVHDPALLFRHGERNARRRDIFDERRCVEALEALYAAGSDMVTPSVSPVVICGGTPSPAVVSLVNGLHDLTGHNLRLIWHAHAGVQDWDAATYFWHWGGDHAAREQALLAGLPVLAPKNSPAALRTVRYDGLLEAAAALHLTASGRPGLGPLQRATLPARDLWRAAGPLSSEAPAQEIVAFEADLRIRAQALGVPVKAA